MATGLAARGPDGPPAPAATVGGVLRAAAATTPDADALVSSVEGRHHVWSFARLLEDATAAARGLARRCAPGSAVVLWSPNRPDVVIAQLAVALAGCTLVPLNPQLRPREVEHALRVTGARLALAAPSYRDVDLPAVLREASGDDPLEVVLLDGLGEALLEGTDAAGTDLPHVTGDDLAQVQLTSGTTGPSKGVRIRHRAMALTGAAFAERLGLRPDGGFCNPMPLFHTAGNVLGVMGALTVGAPHVVLEFAPAAVLAAIEQHRPSVVSLAPTLIDLVQHDERFAEADLSSVTTVFTGGATVSPRAVDDVERAWDARLLITFGMTETCGTALMTGHDDDDATRRAGVGRVMPHTEARVVDTSGRVVGADETGELQLRGPRVTDGYVGDAAATAATIDADGWLRTGDEASMDAHGGFRITGRLKDMIKTGGENVAPSEVEDRLVAHPDVAAAAVVGAPDDRWGEVVAAYVVPTAGAELDLDELDRHCRAELAPFKVPRRVEVVDALPTTASGKVRRAALRDRVATDGGG